MRFLVLAATLVACNPPAYVISRGATSASAKTVSERQPVAGRSDGLSHALALQSHARALGAATSYRQHEPEVRALRELADAIEALPSHPRDAAQRIRDDATQIEASPIGSMQHHVWAKAALRTALQAMGGAHEQARTAVDAIDDHTAFLKQRGAIDDAIGAVADALVSVYQQS